MKRVPILALVAVAIAFAGTSQGQERSPAQSKEPGEIGRRGQPVLPYVPLLPSPYCSQPGRAIRDGATVRDVIFIPDDFFITDLRVSLDITHSSVSDLEIAVENEVDRVDLMWDDCGFNNDLSVTIGDAAPPMACGEPVVGSSETTTRNPPREFLSAFNGQVIRGDWTLIVTDDAKGDQGILNEWCIIITPIPVELVGFEVE